MAHNAVPQLGSHVVLMANKSFDNRFQAGTRARIVGIERHAVDSQCAVIGNQPHAQNQLTEGQYFTTYYHLVKVEWLPVYGDALTLKDPLRHEHLSETKSPSPTSEAFFTPGDLAYLRKPYHGLAEQTNAELHLARGTMVSISTTARTASGANQLMTLSKLFQAHYKCEFRPIINHTWQDVVGIPYLVHVSELQLAQN